jgi:hypothetical protein
MNDYLLGLIEKHHISRTDLARALRLDRTTISKKLSGHRPLMFGEAEKIVAFLRSRKVKVDSSKLL